MLDPVNSNKQHLAQVDYLRAIASVAVALFHLGGKTLPVLKYGWLGVEMFFVLSGFIICYAMPAGYTFKNTRRFIWKRVIRIEPPYLLSVVLLLLLNLCLVNNYKPDWQNVLMHFAYLNSFFGKEYLNPVYWTLAIEFQFYLLIALLFPLFNTRRGKLVLFVTALLFYYISIQGVGLIDMFPFFAAGIFLYLYSEKKMFALEFAVSVLVMLILAWHKSGLLPTAAGLLGLVILLLPLRYHSIVAFFARISFSLYLTHDIIGSRLVVYLGTIWPKTLFYKGIEFTSGIVVSILFAWLFNFVVERPFFRLSKKVAY